MSEDELFELRRLAGERGISIQRTLIDDALNQRAGEEGVRLDGVVIDEVVGELMRLRGEIGRGGNTANQAVRDARRLDSETRKAMRLGDALEAAREIARAASDVRRQRRVWGACGDPEHHPRR